MPAGSAAPALVGQAAAARRFVLPLHTLVPGPLPLQLALPVDNGGPFKDIPPLPLIDLLATVQRVHEIACVPVQRHPPSLYAPLGSHIIQGRFPGPVAEADAAPGVANFPAIGERIDDTAELADPGRGSTGQALHQCDADEAVFCFGGKLGILQDCSLAGQIGRAGLHATLRYLRRDFLFSGA